MSVTSLAEQRLRANRVLAALDADAQIIAGLKQADALTPLIQVLQADVHALSQQAQVSTRAAVQRVRDSLIKERPS